MGGGKPAQGYAHSSIARMIVNDLAIAHYQPKAEVYSTVCRVRRDLSVTVNPRTDVVTLENVNEETVPNFKAYYENLTYLTKHFLIRSLEGPRNSVARHYTICNAMRPDVYNAYIKALKPDSDPQYRPLDRNLLNKSDSSSMTFCIKNYGQARGLSTKIHDENQTDRRFEVKGPMGHGLRPKQTGIHVAFAAGTGALCFVDLVAWLINSKAGRNLGGSSSINMMEDDETEIDVDNF